MPSRHFRREAHCSLFRDAAAFADFFCLRLRLRRLSMPYWRSVNKNDDAAAACYSVAFYYAFFFHATRVAPRRF